MLCFCLRNILNFNLLVFSCQERGGKSIDLRTLYVKMQWGRKRCLAQTVSRGKDTASSASMTKLRVQVSRIGTLQHRPSQGGSKGPCTPIVRKYSHFVLWEAFFQAKLLLFAKNQAFWPPNFWAGYATAFQQNVQLIKQQNIAEVWS